MGTGLQLAACTGGPVTSVNAAFDCPCDEIVEKLAEAQRIRASIGTRS